MTFGPEYSGQRAAIAEIFRLEEMGESGVAATVAHAEGVSLEDRRFRCGLPDVRYCFLIRMNGALVGVQVYFTSDAHRST